METPRELGPPPATGAPLTRAVDDHPSRLFRILARTLVVLAIVGVVAIVLVFGIVAFTPDVY
jgi:hypothetical protein